MHLKPEELIDLAEDTRAEDDVPHLASCEACRRQLADLRAMMTSVAAADIEVPEPSPFFWEALQSRIAATVRTQGFGRFEGFARFFRPAVLAPVGALAAIAIVAVVLRMNSRVDLPPLPDGPSPVASAPQDVVAPDGTSRVELLNDSMVAGDASLQLVADLTSDIDWNTAGEAGLAPRGSAEHAVAHLSSQELAELQRLLRAELANSGV